MRYSNVKMLNVVEPIGVGLLDEGMIYLDGTKGWTKTFRNATDISRVALAVAGYAGQIFMPSANKYFEPVAIAETALLTKSVFQTVKKMINHTGGQVRLPPQYQVLHGPIMQDLPAPIPNNYPMATPGLSVQNMRNAG